MLSCGSSIRLWTLTGQGLMEMISHTSLIYSVDAHASGHIASGSEDQLLKIWKSTVSLTVFNFSVFLSVF